MRHPALPLVVALFAVFGFGRTASDKDTDRAVQCARQLHDRVSNPDGLEVSQALVTGKSVCIDYQSRSRSGGMSIGFAVYEADKKLLFVDNSWIWQRSCLFGKYGQRRDGADVTAAMNSALKRKPASALSREQEAAARPSPPPDSQTRPVLKLRAAVTEERIVATPPAPPVTTAPAPAALPVAPTPAAVVVEATMVTAPVERQELPARPVITPAAPAPPRVTTAPAPAAAPVAPAPAAKVVEATMATAPVERQEPAARTVVVPSAPAPPTEVTPPVTQAPVKAAMVSVPAVTAPAPLQPIMAEIHVTGAVIIGPAGGAPPPVAQESLGDAARRLKREKLQREQKQVP